MYNLLATTTLLPVRAPSLHRPVQSSSPIIANFFFVRFHHLKTIPAHPIAIELLQHSSTIEITLINTGLVAVLLPLYQVLLVYSVISHLLSRSHIDNVD